MRRVLVTGGAGFIGAVLLPKLLQQGYQVTVLDLCLFGESVLETVRDREELILVKGDLRNADTVRKALDGCDAVIHLACISNDPSFELDPQLGRSINYDAFGPLVEMAKSAGVRRFIYASSSSVYGVKEEENVTEDLALEPLTDYSKYKALCEDILRRHQGPDFTTVTIRPATVCGYSPRMRLDLSVNILTNHAVNTGRIRLFGGDQRRPNIHIEDMADLYVDLLARRPEEIAGRIWNAGYSNYRMREIAECVRKTVPRDDIEIATEPTDDMRSYHISSQKIQEDIGFRPRRGIDDAVRDLVDAFAAGRIPNPMDDIRYYNIRTMQALKLQ